jgi:hypothetical protein
MLSRGLRPLSAVVLIFLFSILSTAAVSANTNSKSVNTTTGECTTGESCGSLVYGSTGVSGHLWGTGSASIFDYLCVHTPSDGSFKSFGGSYTFTVWNGATQLATTTYPVASGTDCTAANDAGSGTAATFTYPASGVVTYAVSISGVTAGNAQSMFATYNSVLNRVVDTKGGGHANSESVAPFGPTGEVPEVPAAALLILTGGLGAGWFLLRRRSADSSISTS